MANVQPRPASDKLARVIPFHRPVTSDPGDIAEAAWQRLCRACDALGRVSGYSERAALETAWDAAGDMSACLDEHFFGVGGRMGAVGAFYRLELAGKLEILGMAEADAPRAIAPVVSLARIRKAKRSAARRAGDGGAA